MRNVIILASGPSVRDYRLRGLEHLCAGGKALIAISGAALYVKPDIALCMDRKVSEHCYPLWKIQGVPNIYLRECTLQNICPDRSVTLFQRDGGDHTPFVLTDRPGRLNGSNTGMCALNLAYQMRPQRIFLLGYDMQRGPNNEPYWHPTYPWNEGGAPKNGKLKEWAQEFNIAAQQLKEAKIEVFNVNHRSLIEAFPVISFKEFWKMI